jgi:hypothetical protein
MDYMLILDMSLEGKDSDKTRRNLIFIETNHGLQAQSRCVPGRPLLAPIYRWLGLKDPVWFNTN